MGMVAELDFNHVLLSCTSQVERSSVAGHSRRQRARNV
jgi:hypothetical protein